tara:strand:- start:165 stop:287 length:123 start_codon:yes stop_codon:yes gene_type:complete
MIKPEGKGEKNNQFAKHFAMHFAMHFDKHICFSRYTFLLF